MCDRPTNQLQEPLKIRRNDRKFPKNSQIYLVKKICHLTSGQNQKSNDFSGRKLAAGAIWLTLLTELDLESCSGLTALPDLSAIKGLSVYGRS